jgi:multidrug transporter EmrE-like cation transporter
MIYYLIVVICVFASSISQILLKKSAIEEHQTILDILLNRKVVISYTVMFMTVCITIYAMKHGVLLKDMPILEASGYIFVTVLSVFFLSEKLTFDKVIANILIMLGIVVFYA